MKIVYVFKALKSFIQKTYSSEDQEAMIFWRLLK